MQPVQEVYSLLQQKKNIVITMHQKPDGDAMGSALGLYHFLKELDHDVHVISPTNWARYFNWMPGCNSVIDFEMETAQATEITESADIIFSLDYNIAHRIKRMATLLTETKAVRVLIDHHEQPPQDFFHYGVSNITKSSTAEMVYEFIMNSPNAQLINLDMATCLYTGIMTDTGSFRFAITSANVHRIIAHFKDMGLNHSYIHEQIYDNFLETRLRFIGNALLNRMQVLYEYNTALMAISKQDIQRYDIQTGDTEGLVNYLLSIEGIKLGALLIDRIEERKWSFRSKGNFDVNTFARKHFEGGGHKNAAGGRSNDSLTETLQNFKQVLKEYEQQLQ